jgi:monoamine oxidase
MEHARRRTQCGRDARTTLRDRVFLASEATDFCEASVAGALASGVRAAQQVLRVMV